MSGLITAGSAAWCLLLAVVIHVLVDGRLGSMVPAKVGQTVVPRLVSSLTFAGLAGLTVVTIGAWLRSATNSAAGWTVNTLHIPLAVQIVVGGLALVATVGVLTSIVAGLTISGVFIALSILAAALLAAIPGRAGQFLSALISLVVRVGAFLVGVIFGVV